VCTCPLSRLLCDHASLPASPCAAKATTAEDSAADHAKDVVIENFTIQAHQKELFRNATLRVVHGRRYGLIGPNGQGKTTLLKYMASGELPIPARIDVLYVEQEVIADDTPAIQAVLKADKRRHALLEEERVILASLDASYIAEESGAAAVPGGGLLSDKQREVLEDRLKVGRVHREPGTENGSHTVTPRAF
jgi:ATPase subunit of ABC transporter with duplicated ATPase domains